MCTGPGEPGQHVLHELRAAVLLPDPCLGGGAAGTALLHQAGGGAGMFVGWGREQVGTVASFFVTEIFMFFFFEFLFYAMSSDFRYQF